MWRWSVGGGVVVVCSPKTIGFGNLEPPQHPTNLALTVCPKSSDRRLTDAALSRPADFAHLKSKCTCGVFSRSCFHRVLHQKLRLGQLTSLNILPIQIFNERSRASIYHSHPQVSARRAASVSNGRCTSGLYFGESLFMSPKRHTLGPY